MLFMATTSEQTARGTRQNIYDDNNNNNNYKHIFQWKHCIKSEKSV